MTGEKIVGLFLILICCFGSGALFFGLGIWTKRSELPAHFWAGGTIPADSIQDVRSYNTACARMWMAYSVPYFIAGGFGILGLWKAWAYNVALIMMLLACTLGLWWILATNRKIEETYVQK